MAQRSTERLIQLLASVNGEAIDNDGGKPGEFIEDNTNTILERDPKFAAVYLVEKERLLRFMGN